MNGSRRRFLQAAAGASAGLLLSRPSLFAASIGSEQRVEARGLLFDVADLPRIRRTLQMPRFAPFWKAMTDADIDADRRFLDQELKLDNHTHHLQRADAILGRSAFVFAVTGDSRHAEIARHAMGKILQYKRWDYFLEGGEEVIGLQRAPETTIAMTFGSEWLGGALDAAMRDEVERQIGEKGAPACYLTLYGMRYPDRVKGWGLDPESDYRGRMDLSRWPVIMNTTSLKALSIAGLGISAALLYGRHSMADSWLEMAVQSARAFASNFGSDGSYSEGIGYWGSAVLDLALMVEVLFRRLQRDERHLINFPGTVRYALQMSMPTTGQPGDSVNFGDAGLPGDTAVASWSARERKDGVAQFTALRVGTVQSPYAAVWYDPAVAPATPGKELNDVRFANDWIVGRSGWDERSSVVAMRSGGPSNHEHADRNSVIFKAYGQRLFHDPARAAYDPADPLWLLRQTEAHTAVLIGGKGHGYHDGREGTSASEAAARIVQFQKDDRFLYAVSDATQAYALVNNDVVEALRALLFIKPDVLVLFDRLRLLKSPLPIQIRYQVDNEDGAGVARTDNNTFTIMRPGVSLQGTIYSMASVQLRTDFLDLPSAKEPYPFVEAEDSTGTVHQVLTVCTVQESGRWHGQLDVRHSGEVWHVEGTHSGRRVNATIDASGTVPILAVVPSPENKR